MVESSSLLLSEDKNMQIDQLTDRWYSVEKGGGLLTFAGKTTRRNTLDKKRRNEQIQKNFRKLTDAHAIKAKFNNKKKTKHS